MTDFENENKALKGKIKTLNKIGLALSNTDDTDKLLQMILDECMNLTYSDGGSIYIKEKYEGTEYMVIKHVANRSIDFDYKGERLKIDDSSITGTVAKTGKIKISKICNSVDNKITHDAEQKYSICNMMTVPMKNDKKEVIGVLQMLNKKITPNIKLREGDDFCNNIVDYTEDDIETVTSLASQLAVLVHRIELNKKLLRNVSQTRTTLISFFNGMKQAMATIGEDILEEQEKFKKYATVDSLTGLMSRREGIAFLEKQLEFARFNGIKTVICFIDINGLKFVNDNFGHKTGDEMIKAISDIIKNNARGNDTIFRYGGDEFILLIDNIDINTSQFVWRRIENNFKAFNKKSSKPYKISAAHGFAEYDPNINQSIDELIKLADSEMYKNKKEMKAQR